MTFMEEVIDVLEQPDHQPVRWTVTSAAIARRAGG